MQKILLNTITKNILCNLTQPNSGFHTTPGCCSKRFTRCSKCGTQYQKFKDNCCPLIPPSKRTALDASCPTPTPTKKKPKVCSGGMMNPCLKDAYKNKCAITKFRTNDCPPVELPPCPKGDWNRGDA